MGNANESSFDRFMHRSFNDVFRASVDVFRAGTIKLSANNNVSDEERDTFRAALLPYRNNRISWRMDPLYGSKYPTQREANVARALSYKGKKG